MTKTMRHSRASRAGGGAAGHSRLQVRTTSPDCNEMRENMPQDWTGRAMALESEKRQIDAGDCLRAMSALRSLLIASGFAHLVRHLGPIEERLLRHVDAGPID